MSYLLSLLELSVKNYYMIDTLPEVGETLKEKFERRLTEVIKTNSSIV